MKLDAKKYPALAAVTAETAPDYAAEFEKMSTRLHEMIMKGKFFTAGKNYLNSDLVSSLSKAASTLRFASIIK